jgi:hypothetical protein
MKYTIVDRESYLRADLLERQSAEETEAFLKAIGVQRRKHQHKGVLICVHPPRAFFRVEKYHASSFLDTLAGLREVRVALVSPYFEVRLLHQYLEVLARLKGANLRSFAAEAAAIRWLTAPETPSSEPSSATR